VAVVLIHLLFSLLFTLVWWPLNPEPANMPGLALATLIIGFAMVSPVTLPAGALGGWLLYWLGRHLHVREQAP
jgi:membrane protein DedA with SNARE-associated domain